MRESHAKRVRFSHVRVFSDTRNVQKRATKSDTSGHCLPTRPDPISRGHHRCVVRAREGCVRAVTPSQAVTATVTVLVQVVP